MKLTDVKAVLRELKTLKDRPSHAFLKQTNGVLHVGANTGQERLLYRSFSLPVVWVEPIPDVATQLRANLARYPEQRAIEALITNEDDKAYEFNIANNAGASSSILELRAHRDMWEEVEYVSTISLTSMTLATLANREQLTLDDYALVLDTQGSELLVLEGGKSILDRFSYIKTEVPDFESYQDCAQLEDVEEFMHAQGFVEHRREKFASRAGIGNYYDVVYRRSSM